ncbi:septum site-determining protein MinC [Desulfallas thermosapovorans]|uniref:septum site-determining protein MinC n=1 Tax=Desulfallas thermosapovorans TaxID=58137 RepID=UPI00141228BF|nr:septum site-determining protein MinC [Desulfallas thermosapovorans]
MPKEAVDIKGTKNGLIILLDPNRDFEDIKTGLKNKMESASGFFSGARFTLYHEKQLYPTEKTELESICKSYGLIPNPEAKWPLNARKSAGIPKEPVDIPGEAALLVKRTLRSGQMVNYHGHVTVLGNIHPGAKVLATGNIIVMGTCSGFVHAGQTGNKEAFIMAFQFNNSHLRIADQTLYYEPEQSFTGPVLAKIEQGKIILLAQYE